jgi:hypothetical protein
MIRITRRDSVGEESAGRQRRHCLARGQRAASAICPQTGYEVSQISVSEVEEKPILLSAKPAAYADMAFFRPIGNLLRRGHQRSRSDEVFEHHTYTDICR